MGARSEASRTVLPLIGTDYAYVSRGAARRLAPTLVKALADAMAEGRAVDAETVATVRAIDWLAERSESGTEARNGSAQPAHSDRRVLTAVEAARVLGCSDRQVRALCAERAIPAVKSGGAWQIEADTVDAYAAALRKGT